MMKLLKIKVSLILIILLCSCSKENSGKDINSEDETAVMEESVEILDFIGAEIIAETPVPDFNTHVVFGDKLYSISMEDTYAFDFDLAKWTLLTSDSETPSTDFDYGIDFMRNGKWNRFMKNGLYEFDFDLLDWTEIKKIPFLPYEIFSAEGFYVEEDDAIYFIDQVNSKDEIFKYDLISNELIIHSTFSEEGGWFPVSKSSFKINDTYYVVSLSARNTMKISKFDENFTTFETLNKQQIANSFDTGVAAQFENNIVFGLGGVPSADSDNIIDFDPSNLKFFLYDTDKNIFSEMPTPFYESCRAARLVTYNNEFYLINGATIKNSQSEIRNTIEKLEFGYIKR